MEERTTSMEATGLEVAIVGMAARVPGAGDVEELWRNLRGGVEGISVFSDRELVATGVAREALERPGYVKARGVLEGADLFDAGFFGYSPREAELIDPQQRVFLECCRTALEDAGYDPARYAGLVGVYGSAGLSGYLGRVLGDPALLAEVGSLQAILGNDKDFLCTRVAYKLGLRGPATTVQSACSSSLVAVHLACQALLAGECEMALAGGVSVAFPQRTGYHHQEGSVLSPDGHCRAFDARAAGSVPGQGVAVVVLKRLEEALAEGDPIRAVIRGSATNNDGAGRIGFTAPAQEGQARVILAALQTAEVAPETIGYVEAHGTGTELGDPIEVAALRQAFEAAGGTPAGSCALGSVKSNLGHLDTAAGVAGLVKAVLALEHREIPPSLHFETPNPRLGLAGSPFRVATELQPWLDGPAPRRAGVSSFGLGGTNAHVVLEEAPAVPEPEPSPRWQLYPLAARGEGALARATEDLARHLEGHPELEPGDVAFTLQAGRGAFEHRRAVVARDLADAAAVLSGGAGGRLWTGRAGDEPRPVVFLFPGVGEQYPGMAEGLYRSEPAFRQAFDRCAELFREPLGVDLREVVHPADPSGGRRRSPDGGLDLRALLGRGDAAGEAAADGPLARTAVLQPALFAVEYSLAHLWSAWGVRPEALMGYSLGEYVAACVAGVLPLEAMAGLMAERARRMDALPAGAMLAVPLPEAEVAARLPADLAVSAVLAPRLTVVSGPEGAVAALEAGLAQAGTLCRRVVTPHAAHGPAMEPLAAWLREELAGLPLAAPRIPFVSNLTGTWITAEQATDPGYWAEQACRPVRFAAGLEALLAEPGRIFLEMGPGQLLGSLVLQAERPAAEAPAPLVLPTLGQRHDHREDRELALESVARLWLAGVEPDWPALHASRRPRRVSLPTYPFERRRYLLEPAVPAGAPAEAPGSARAEDPEDWLYVPSWRRAAPLPPGGGSTLAGRWLVLAAGSAGSGGPGDLDGALAAALEAAGAEAVRARLGARNDGGAQTGTVLDPADPAQVEALLEDLPALPEGIVLTVLAEPAAEGDGTGVADGGRAGYLALHHLVGALARRPGAGRRLVVVTHGLADVERGDAPVPGHALVAGALRAAALESPEIELRLVDVDPDEPVDTLAARVVAEVAAAPPELPVALRGGQRWVREFERWRFEAPPEVDGLRPGGVYLVTGGLGGVGLLLARHLAESLRPRLALLGRTPLAAGGPGETSEAENDRLEAIRELEAAGAEVLTLAADVADEAAMRRAVGEIRERFGRIDGVFHLAGVPGGGLMQLRSARDAAAVLRPKVEGTVVLERVLADDPPDLLVLFSSLSAVAGAIGQADYCAANAFLGSWALARSRSTGAGRPGRVVALDWGEWREDRWTGRFAALDPALAAELAERRRRFGFSAEEGMVALRRALASGAPWLQVSTQDFRPFLRRSTRRAERVAAAAEVAAAPGPRHPRPALATAYEPPRGEVQAALAEIWEELLGVDRVGVNDRFLDLGGHSLLGLQVVARIRERLGVALPLQALFECPTVAELAGRVEGAAGEAATGPATGPEIRPSAAERDLQDLPEEELDHLLAELLAQDEGRS